MVFRYFDYLTNALLFPGFVLIFTLSAIFLSLKPEVKAYFTTGEIDWQHLKQKLLLNAILIIAIVVLIIILTNGGFQMIADRPSEAVTVTGTIEQIEARNSFQGMKFWSDYGESYGVELTINGETCIAMAQGDLQIGDCVTATYLPNSGFVLSIDKAS